MNFIFSFFKPKLSKEQRKELKEMTKKKYFEMRKKEIEGQYK